MSASAAQTGPGDTLRFGVYLPNVGWESLPGPSQLVDYAVAAEQLGFDSVWVGDSLIAKPRLEPLTTRSG